MFNRKNQTINPVGHFCTGYRKAIDVGFGAIKAEADAKSGRSRKRASWATRSSATTLPRDLDSRDGMITLTKRYAKEVEDLRGRDRPRTQKSSRRWRALSWCVENRARSSKRSDPLPVQYFLRSMPVCTGSASAVLTSISVLRGRSSAGRITPEYAQEIMDLFYLKIASINKL